jgi:hypothetical protein
MSLLRLVHFSRITAVRYFAMAKGSRRWDGALEELLRASSFTTEVHWSDRAIETVAEAKTFVDAVNRPRAPRATRSGAPTEDPCHVRENHVRRMVLAPLSPRKPVIIPCPYAAVKQRDNQTLEQVIRHRRAGSTLGKIASPVKQKENSNAARPPTVKIRTFNSMASSKPVFYWGA